MRFLAWLYSTTLPAAFWTVLVELLAYLVFCLVRELFRRGAQKKEAAHHEGVNNSMSLAFTVSPDGSGERHSRYCPICGSQTNDPAAIVCSHDGALLSEENTTQPKHELVEQIDRVLADIGSYTTFRAELSAFAKERAIRFGRVESMGLFVVQAQAQAELVELRAMARKRVQP